MPKGKTKKNAKDTAKKGKGGGSISAYSKRTRETEEIEKKGGCDGNAATLAKTNGVAQTLMWVENTGTCPVTLYCTDAQGRIIQSTSHTLPAGDSLRSYSSPASAHAIMINCPASNAQGATCKIEMDA
ncbi:MAG: hypothetical protein RLO23_02055 [Alphaproteobacteria bacterium]